MTGSDIGKSLCQHFFTKEFFEKHWEKAPLHYRAADKQQDAATANSLPQAISTDDVVSIIERGSIKMFKDMESYDSDNFWMGYMNGASIVVNQADRYNQQLLDMCRCVAEEHFLHVFAVLYLTPRNSQAVRIHTDDQDVFLMQVWGRKHWTVRNAPVKLPYTEEMLGKGDPVPKDLIGDPLMSFTIEPGDILYIPRGHLHEATTSQEPSLHITVTVPTSDYCWGVQFARSLTETLHSRSFPPELAKMCDRPMVSVAPSGGATKTGKKTNEEDVEKQMQGMLTEWLSQLSLDGIVDAFEERMLRTNNGQDKSLAMNLSRKTAPRVTESCRVRLMPGMRCTLKEWSKLAIFECSTGPNGESGGGGRLELPVLASCIPLISSLTSKPKAVTALPSTDRFERLCILQLLLMQGVLQIFTASPPAPATPQSK